MSWLHWSTRGSSRSWRSSGLDRSLSQRRVNDTAGKTTNPPLSLPGGTWSGVTLHVSGTPGGDQMMVDGTLE